MEGLEGCHWQQLKNKNNKNKTTKTKQNNKKPHTNKTKQNKINKQKTQSVPEILQREKNILLYISQDLGDQGRCSPPPPTPHPLIRIAFCNGVYFYKRQRRVKTTLSELKPRPVLLLVATLILRSSCVAFSCYTNIALVLCCF